MKRKYLISIQQTTFISGDHVFDINIGVLGKLLKGKIGSYVSTVSLEQLQGFFD